MHIHCASLATEAARYTSPDEQLKAASLLDPRKKKILLSGRGLLREILGRYLGLDPNELNFSVATYGKPYLDSCCVNGERLHFNLSHSDDLFLLAVASDREVGIDVEKLHSDVPFADLARLAFSASEQQELFALPVHLQRSAFYRCWTRKEAYMKASGKGFNMPSNGFTVSLLPGAMPELIIGDNTSLWIQQEITVPHGYCAALVVYGSTAIVRYIK